VRSSSVVSDAGSEPLRRTSERSRPAAGEGTFDLSGVGDLTVDHGSGNDLVVQHDGETAMNVLACKVAELMGSIGCEREADVRLASCPFCTRAFLRSGAVTGTVLRTA